MSRFALAGCLCLIATTALVIAIIGIALPRTARVSSGSGGGLNGGLNQINGAPVLSVYDTRIQTLTGPGVWTNVKFNTEILGSSGWNFIVGSESIISNTTGLSLAYFSIEAQFNGATLATSLTCKPCNLRYSLRAVIQRVGDTDFTEIPGSRTYSSGHNFFLAKQFFIDTNVDDILRFQFHSLCGDLALVPSPMTQTNLSSTESALSASATLLLF